MLTVYGRKAVQEVLQDPGLDCHALHLADSNIEKGIVAEIRALAESRNIPVNLHSRIALSRISKNGKQDQGVAADIICPAFNTLEDYLCLVLCMKHYFQQNRYPQRLVYFLLKFLLGFDSIFVDLQEV